MSKAIPSFSLNLSANAPKQTKTYDEESDIHEPVTVKLTLPDGTSKTLNVTVGTTIQIIKKMLETDIGLSYKDNDCFYNGKIMMEPLSLNDFPGFLDSSDKHIEIKKR
eukprot:TRINITY_DN1561_c0_g1_i1.p1 TRINITY_DN1561_c0_g1~~TRINITY_DN1561_c0_g1_i1.p1  ORF type:complete len:108 (-),score=16.68 TRINITY_DN1561_c0_g1_i1:184-507(-)